MTPQPPVQLVDVLRSDFRTSLAADNANSALQHALGLPFRYHPARLAIGRSLAEPDLPPAAQDLSGRPIKGETLFGQDEHELAIWIGLLIERHQSIGTTKRDLQDMAAAHWQRGIALLQEAYATSNDRSTFLAQLGVLCSRAGA